MNKSTVYIITFLATLAFCVSAWATPAPAISIYDGPIGKNITIFDGQSKDTYEWYQGTGVGKEDQETEPDTLISEAWDLEAMFIRNTILSLVGQWNFVTGEEGASGSYDRDGDGKYTSGDLFIDIDGVDYGSTYGYDFVFDVDWNQGTYTLFSLNSDSTFDQTTYKTDSNPWKVATSGSEIIDGTFTMEILSDSLVDKEGLYAEQADYQNHYIVSFDLAPILSALNLTTMDFTAHFTMECGNDNLMGHGTAPVPEPATIILMGLGLIGITGITRKKLNMERPE